MPRIVAKADNLNELNANYTQERLLEPIFLNSVPKCGTHLVRNVMRMFVPVDQQYHQAFIQHAILRQHQAAFSEAMPHLSWGHLLFSDDAAIVLRHVHHVVQIRDPYDWVLARTRFFLSDTFQGSLEHLKGGNVSIDEVINMMIFGNIETDEAEIFFSNLIKDCGIEKLPEDWRERVRVGADRQQSGTARENLVGGGKAEVPDELTDLQKELVNYAAPGLRKLLGYE
jgi:hypothetical protein